MIKDKKTLLMLISSALFPLTLMLYLFNRNAKYLSLPQVAITTAFFTVLALGIFVLYRRIFRSGQAGLTASIICTALLFLYNNIYENYLYIYVYGHLVLLIIPVIAYFAAYVVSLITKKKKFDELPEFISIVLSVVLVINLFNFGKNILYVRQASGDYEYKTSFVTETGLPSPNVYWILCDGMLGFDAMEKYFQDPQVELTAKLETRGFAIDRGAMLESGHSTRIAVPELMCPEYCDKYLKTVLSNHEAAMDLYNSSDAEMFNARYHNETINAFASKGYTTISMSLDEDVFFPTTDFFYYLAASYTSDREYAKLPYYVKTSEIEDVTFLESKFYAMHLGDVFLAGIPDIVFNFLNKRNVPRFPLTVNTDTIQEILPTSIPANKYSVILKSLYDSLYSKEIEEPKFTLLHAFMAHFPLCFDEDGNMVERINNIMSYPGHHAFAAKILMNMVDLILEADPDAVIVLQADHGLHGQSKEQITKVFESPDAEIDIWNNIFSAIRVPEKFVNGDEHYAVESPLNISRYLVNSYVGQNYEYIAGE